MDNFQRGLLLGNVKKSIELWFLAGKHITKVNFSKSYEASALEQIQVTVLEILVHGFNFGGRQTKSKNHILFLSLDGDASEPDSLRKLIEDFEWVRRTAQIRDAFKDQLCASPPLSSTMATAPSSLSKSATATPTIDRKQNAVGITISGSKTVKQFFCSWILRNLKSNCLCACLQALIADKELLECYYETNAFLRTENYSTALIICLSALELNQYSLLSQIDVELMHIGASTACVSINSKTAKHKRSSSHPNFSLSPPKRGIATVSSKLKLNDSSGKPKEILITPATPQAVPTQPIFPTFRKTKSQPEIHETIEEFKKPDAMSSTRPRSKTMCAHPTRSFTISAPKSIPKTNDDKLKHRLTTILISPSNTSSSYSDEDQQPSTSAGSRHSQNSNLTFHSDAMSTSTDSSKATSRRIELIKCDDIKIWTDQSHELQNQINKSTASCDIPKKLSVAKQGKSISPINSFLSSLFSTPPTYTSWAVKQNAPSEEQSSCVGVPADPSCSVGLPAISHEVVADDTKKAGIFNVFLPIYGKKLRSRKSQSLFEDGISTLDYSMPSARPNSDPIDAATVAATRETLKASLKNCDSLTSFLQLSNLSRNNTELEKENAHFRISEAIISAIEHIKWAKLEPDKWRRESETVIATDWLEHEHRRRKSLRSESDFSSSEHIPYAELGESGLDLPSAEVVGLTLISKFNDKHLPKVSKLKWLVSDEDTPQNLLPMPDSTPAANPDENVLPPLTRGTRYWAPPRPQIIFTDYLPPNRKQLIKKQNNRCAGCGMRVAPQYIHSFRYCTYLNKYHCTGCHRNQISAIPAKIIHKWDFKCYPVSVFAYRLLEQMYTYPLFCIPDLNPALYINQKVMLKARTKRVQLKFIKDFIKLCRFAVKEQQYFDVVPEHITNDPDMWSLADFIDVENGSMKHSINELMNQCEQHIFHCVLCTARGFFCEYCHKDDIIYPWESKTFRCDSCGLCFHAKCWRSMAETCQRCQRIEKRQFEQKKQEYLNF